MGSREDSIRVSQRRSLSRTRASSRRRARRPSRSVHSLRTAASNCGGLWRRTMARAPASWAARKPASSMPSHTASTGMSLPLAATAWATASKAMLLPCCAASTRSMAWAPSMVASSLSEPGRSGRTAMPELRRPLTIASASSTRSSTIIRRRAWSGCLDIRVSVEAALCHAAVPGVHHGRLKVGAWTHRPPARAPIVAPDSRAGARAGRRAARALRRRGLRNAQRR